MKFELNQTIYYFRENRTHSAPVISRKCVENGTSAPGDFFSHFGAAGVTYVTCHGEVTEEEAFASKEELVASL